MAHSVQRPRLPGSPTGGYSFIPHDEVVPLRPFCPLGFTVARAVSGIAGRTFSLPIILPQVAQRRDLEVSDV